MHHTWHCLCSTNDKMVGTLSCALLLHKSCVLVAPRCPMLHHTGIILLSCTSLCTGHCHVSWVSGTNTLSLPWLDGNNCYSLMLNFHTRNALDLFPSGRTLVQCKQHYCEDIVVFNMGNFQNIFYVCCMFYTHDCQHLLYHFTFQ